MARLDSPRVLVAVGLVFCPNTGKILMAQRNASQHQAMCWEFPGGKVEPGESVSQALVRELEEEVGIHVQSHFPFMDQYYDYPDKNVHLAVHCVDGFQGHAKGLENQPIQWVSLDALQSMVVPKANEAIVKKLLEQKPSFLEKNGNY